MQTERVIVIHFNTLKLPRVQNLQPIGCSDGNKKVKGDEKLPLWNYLAQDKPSMHTISLHFCLGGRLRCDSL